MKPFHKASLFTLTLLILVIPVFSNSSAAAEDIAAHYLGFLKERHLESALHPFTSTDEM